MFRSALLQVVFRGRSTLSHQTHLRPRPLLESPPTQQQVCVRWASCAARLGVDWDSLGIWDRRQEDPLLLPSSVGPRSTQVSLSWVGSASVLGRRKHNEDRLRVGRLHDNLLYLAVFDGHGGAHAADYCCTHLDTHLRKALEEEEDLEKVVTQAFLNLDRALHRHLSNYGNTSHLTAGTTATVAMLRVGTELVVGSVGDSRALLCRRGRAHKLTHDHTPDRRDERDRIKSCGGFVAWNSVGVAYVDGRLAMTRSIGDFHLKHHGVIPTPETTRVTVSTARPAPLWNEVIDRRDGSGVSPNVNV